MDYDQVTEYESEYDYDLESQNETPGSSDSPRHHRYAYDNQIDGETDPLLPRYELEGPPPYSPPLSDDAFPMRYHLEILAVVLLYALAIIGIVVLALIPFAAWRWALASLHY